MKKYLLLLCALLLTAWGGVRAQTETTAYKFVCSDWVSLDQNRATASDIEYDEDANTITVVKTGDYNVALGNSTAMSQWGGITTENYTVSGWQHWFIVVGTNLSTTATAIKAVESDVIADDAIYDLSGRRVAKAVKGVYIQNGKKVLVK